MPLVQPCSRVTWMRWSTTRLRSHLLSGALRLLEGRQQTLVALTPLLEDFLKLLYHACNAVIRLLTVAPTHGSQGRQSRSDCCDVPQPTSYGSGAFCATLASAGGAKLTAMAAAAATSRPRRLAAVTSASGSAAAHTVTDLRSGAAICRLAIKVATLNSIRKASTGFIVRFEILAASGSSVQCCATLLQVLITSDA